MATPESESGREPSNADLLAAIHAIARTQSQHGEAIAALAGKVDAVAGRQDELALNFAAHAELAESRHVETAQALEAVAGLVHGQQHVIAQSEARVLSRIDDVQLVVQKLKADLAAHVSDTQAHRDSHGTAA